MKLQLLDRRLAICRLGPDEAVPLWASSGSFLSITRTADELSIVCDEGSVPQEVTHAGGWRCLKVEGPLEFEETGILLSLISPLASAGIAVFVVSTHDTDYILIRESRLDEAKECLVAAGHHVAP